MRASVVAITHSQFSAMTRVLHFEAKLPGYGPRYNGSDTLGQGGCELGPALREAVRSRSCPNSWCSSDGLAVDITGRPGLSAGNDWRADDGIVAQPSDRFQAHVAGPLNN